MHLPFHLRHSAFDRAIEQLRAGRAGESGYGRRVALLLTLPTYDDPVAYDIRRDTLGELYVIRTVWQRALDMTSMRATRATLVHGRALAIGLDVSATRKASLISTRVPVESAALEALLETVSSATVSCHVEQPQPRLDATVFEVTFGEELVETRYRWAAEPPEGWAPLGRFVAGVLHLVELPAPASSR